MHSSLEPDRADAVAWGRAAVDFLADFMAGLPDVPAHGGRVGSTDDGGTNPGAPDDGGTDDGGTDDGGTDATARAAQIKDLLQPPAEGPAPFADLLETFGAASAAGVETAGPRYLAYVPAGGLYASALGELLSRGVNRYTGIAGLSPHLIALEEGVLRWLCAQFALPRGSGGLTTTGGSLATLTAVVSARHHMLGDDFADGTLYVTDHTHHCVAKAARVAGFPARCIRTVPTTPDLRMDPEAAAHLIRADRAAGRRPFLLVGTAGSTDTGTVDPLGELGELARREHVWFHVDAAYGGFFQLTERGRRALAGAESADSLALDPHKSMFLPYGTGILLFRDAAPVRAAHTGSGSYLQDLDDDAELPDYADYGAELSREFRGLRLWLPLHLHGVAAFRSALDEKLDLAHHAHQDLSADPHLDVPWEPDLSTVVFRHRDGDDATRHLLTRLNTSGDAFVSSTRIDGRMMIRLCILSFRTHREHVQQALDTLHTAARETAAGGTAAGGTATGGR